MTVLIVVIVLAILLAVAAGAALALTSRHRYRRGNELVSGTPTRAPADWAGAHTPEARLHRRLRDALRALENHPRHDDASFVDLRGSLQQQAVAVDEQLIAVAALPERVRSGPLIQVAAAVRAIEDAAASLATAMTPGAPMLEQSTAELTQRLLYVAEARAELDRLYPPAPPGP